MKKRELSEKIIHRLKSYYGSTKTVTLDYETPWQLLTATILSAQCTDVRVNMVTKTLFKEYPTAMLLKNARLEDVENIIHSLGFYHAKAKNIIAMSKDIVDRFNNIVPSSLEDLISLPGVGRKTANVLRGNIFNKPSIVVDTHVKRVSKRMGLTDEISPTKVEMDLMKSLKKENWIMWNVLIITHGRNICTSRKPKCEICPIEDICRKNI